MNSRLRYEVLKRDGFTCRYCGGGAPDVKLTVDHVVPVALGGQDEPTNLVAACFDCNAGKASVSPDDATVANVQEDAIRWAEAIKAAAAEQAQDAEMERFVVEEFEYSWSCWTVRGEPAPRPADWEVTVRGFYRSGLESELLVDLMNQAMKREHIVTDQKFRYWCGMCWRTLEQRHKRAAEIVAADREGSVPERLV